MTLRYPYEVRDEQPYFEGIPELKLPKDMMDLASHRQQQVWALPLRAATRADRTFVDAWYNLSDLLDEQGRVEAATDCLRTVLRVAPDYVDAMFNLALLL